jgi:peptide/nickel transport system ATP-binding protein
LSAPLLTVEGLHVTFPTPRGPVDVVRDVSFSLGRERLGIVGESGSGKSMTGRSILKLIRAPGKVTAKKLEFDGIDLLKQSEKQMRAIRGARISMVMQDPKFSLNPVMTVKEQIAEALRTHQKLAARDIHARVLSMLEAVRISDPERVARLYPHELSGGMGQRVMIAMMLIPEPDILIADEPTSALDVSVQAQVLDIIDELVRRKGMGLIFISHDLNLVSSYCDRIVVMNAGRIVEECKAGELMNATHPYTRALISAVPRLDETREELPVLDRSAYLDVFYGRTQITHGVNLDILEGESFALVGESGSGKSTVLKAIAGLAPEWQGSISAYGQQRGHSIDRAFSRTCQMVFQDPYGSLHPRKTVDAILSEPLTIHGIGNQDTKVEDVLTSVGLDRRFRFRFPHQLSGGQRQRVAIARALILEPKLMLLDEPTSALDVSVQAEILNLLKRIRRERNLTYLMVTHNLPVVSFLCDRLAVMRHGRIVEVADVAQLKRGELLDPYSRELIDTAVTH